MEKNIVLSDNQKRLIERLGVYHEKGGMSPAASRILSLVTVADTTELSFDQIRDCLNLSKSATSNAINLLITMEKIEYITYSGDRKRYFRRRIESWKESMIESFNNITKVADLLEEIVEQRPAESEKFNNHIKEVISFMRFIKEELPSLYFQWEKEKNK